MKAKTVLQAILILMSVTTTEIFSQIPNSGFENWTNAGNYFSPDNWMTTNYSSTSGFYPVRMDTSHYPPSVGSYSIRMENKPSLMPGTEALGIAISGTSFNMAPDFPITGHPNSLTGYYKYAPLNGDTMHILIVLFNNTTFVASGIFETTAAAPNWTPFTMPISNYTTANSAKIYMGAYNISDAPPQYVPYGNSVLYIDNLNFDTFISGGISDDDQGINVSVYPNPTEGKFNVESEILSGTISIRNLLGEEIYTSKITNGKMEIDLREKAKGLYYIRISSESSTGKVIASKKIIIK